MSQTFAKTIDGNDIYAKRAECDAAGNDLALTYATKGELPNGVPAVTSADSGKVLKASYSGGTGSYSWQKPVFVAVYGTTTYQAVMDAVSSGSLVFCQVGNTETTYRRAVLSYVDSGLGKVEFLYYRSVGAHSASQQGDQAIIYTVDSTNAWTTTTRESYTAIAAGTHMSQSYNNGTLTLNATWPTVDQTYSAASTNAQSGTAVAGAIAGVEQVPTVTSNDNNKVLKASYSGGVGSYSWQTESGGGGGGDGADWAAEQGEPGYIENKPVPKTLTGGTGISITESASTITVSCNVTAPVQDVTVDGTSVVSNGVAAITMPTPPTVDQTYDGTSTNAQSGVAVADAIGNLGANLSAAQIQSLKEALGIDETVLWEDANGQLLHSGITLSESRLNFKIIRLYLACQSGINLQGIVDIPMVGLNTGSAFQIQLNLPFNNETTATYALTWKVLMTATNTTLTSTNALYWGKQAFDGTSANAGSWTQGSNANVPYIYKVVGIGRIASN